METQFEEIKEQLINFVRLRMESHDQDTREAAELMERKLTALTLSAEDLRS